MYSKPQSSCGGRKRPTTTASKPLPPEGAIECPRCNSPNTKFCYYNNYSISQPRYYCKSCRRYWTKGGALRNVPIGGASRKYRKTKASVSSSSSTTITTSALPFLTNPFNSITTDPIQLGIFPFLATSVTTSMVGMNYPLLVHGTEINGCNISWSIESLSCINQELYWKLQQQEMEMLFGDNYSLPGLPVTAVGALQHQKQQESVAVPFQSCGSSGGTSEGCVADADTVTAWFLDGSYTMANDSSKDGSN